VKVALYERLGVGAYGGVYSGNARGQRCAMKCATQSLHAKVTEFVFINKLNALARVRHRNVVGLMGSAPPPPLIPPQTSAL